MTNVSKQFFVSAVQAYQLWQEGYRVLEVGDYPRREKQGHLPGAQYLNTNEIETVDNGWNILSAAECWQVFGEKGITNDRPLLIYSSSLSAACRVAFVAYWLGVSELKILEDGLVSWQALNYPLEKSWQTVPEISFFSKTAPARPWILLSASEDLLAAQKSNPELVLASVRSLKEHQGTTSSYTYIEQAGEPAGAVRAKASCGKNDVDDLLTADHKIKPLAEIARAWARAGITADREIVFYCGTGWRASVAFFIAKELGWEKVRLFDGGWYDWSKKHAEDPKRFPIKK